MSVIKDRHLKLGQRSTAEQEEVHGLESILQRQDIWRGGQEQALLSASAGYPTGYAELDQHLAEQGWPKVGVCELFHHHFGQGEMSIFLPLLRSLIPLQTDKDLGLNSSLAGGCDLVTFIAPPMVPYAVELTNEGIDTSRLLLVNTQDRKEQLWALEQCLTSGSCPLVVVWLNRLSTIEARRLQLACEKGKSLAMILLPRRLAEQSHPVALKIAIDPMPARTEADLTQHAQNLLNFGQSVQILKRRGGWPTKAFSLPLASKRLLLNLKWAASTQKCHSATHFPQANSSASEVTKMLHIKAQQPFKNTRFEG